MATRGKANDMGVKDSRSYLAMAAECAHHDYKLARVIGAHKAAG